MHCQFIPTVNSTDLSDYLPRKVIIWHILDHLVDYFNDTEFKQVIWDQ